MTMTKGYLSTGNEAHVGEIVNKGRTETLKVLTAKSEGS